MGYLNSTPIDNILVECREIPCSKRIYLLVDRFVLKLISSQHHLACKLNILVTTHMTSSYCKMKPTPPMVDSFCKIAHNFGKVIATSNKPLIFDNEYEIGKLSLSTEEFYEYRSFPEIAQDSTLQNEILKKCPGYITFYTDGSKREEEVGAAWFNSSDKTNACFKLHPATSTYSAEMFAIYEALKQIKNETNQNNNKFLILTDCKSAVQILTKNPLNINPTHLHLDILKTYKSLTGLGTSIKIAWIKGHAGIKGNQEVDRWAKHATTYGNSPHDYKITPSDIKAFLERNIKHTLGYYEWQGPLL
jgi:Ribonuclease HI